MPKISPVKGLNLFHWRRLIAVLWACLPFWACYSFKGISVDPAVRTYNVQIFENQALNAPSTLGVDFTEKLKDKIRTETRLLLDITKPDVEFSGIFEDYRVTPVAPKPGETVAFNRLEIRLKVNFLNNNEPEKGWSTPKSFSFFQEFASDKELLAVQDQLITDISKQLLEDVFNAAFNNW
ncbi:MAG: hypothetical protein KGS48_05490 [Bacteroidetes bacterium]|nr:hypothetical protein [Bacteroidota bacterium]